MLSLQRLIAGCLLLLPVVESRAGIPYDYGIDVTGSLARRQNSDRILVTNLWNGTEGRTPARLELRELKADRYKWDLYQLALSMFHWSHPDAADSWYQIAGIHGFPFVPWNEVAGVNHDAGYCQHASILFASWHRPYLALIEQQLYSRVQRIASLFVNETERPLYEAAARNWRMPYWDWARTPSDGGPVYLEDFGEEMINIYGPNGWQLVSNPLYSYHFSRDEMLAFNFPLLQVWNETKRAPGDRTGDAVSNNDQVAGRVAALLPQNQQTLFMLFSSYHNFTSFSNRSFRDDDVSDTEFASIESLHDTMHNILGSGGHMEFIMYSSFDPIFFLHHTNVDRLIAMWQALNPSSWVAPEAAQLPSFTNQAGAILDDTSDLKPFYANADGEFWTSETSRDTLPFGYVYDDTADVSLTGHSETQALEDLREVIREKYGGAGPFFSTDDAEALSARVPGAGVAARFRRNAMASGYFVPDLSGHADIPSPPPSLIMKADGRYTEWLVNIRYRIGEIDRPMTILFFLGHIPDDPSAWRPAPNLAGTFGMLSMGAAADAGAQATGAVPLTAALTKIVAARMVQSLEREDMADFLRADLRFRVLDAEGEVVHLGKLEGLVIKVASASVRASRCKGEFPDWGRPVTSFTATGN